MNLLHRVTWDHKKMAANKERGKAVAMETMSQATSLGMTHHTRAQSCD